MSLRSTSKEVWCAGTRWPLCQRVRKNTEFSCQCDCEPGGVTGMAKREQRDWRIPLSAHVCACAHLHSALQLGVFQLAWTTDPVFPISLNSGRGKENKGNQQKEKQIAYHMCEWPLFCYSFQPCLVKSSRKEFLFVELVEMPAEVIVTRASELKMRLCTVVLVWSNPAVPMFFKLPYQLLQIHLHQHWKL